jgi:hypothetical protein
MPQPVIDIRFPELPQDDAVSAQHGQRRERQVARHDSRPQLTTVPWW